MSEKIYNKKQLIEIFEKGCKSKKEWKIGTEHEKFGFQKRITNLLILSKLKEYFIL